MTIEKATVVPAYCRADGTLDSRTGRDGKPYAIRFAIRYYEQLGVDNGGQQRTAEWSRLFLVPGMGHCGGGPATLDQFDMLDAVVGWVEKGAAQNADSFECRS